MGGSKVRRSAAAALATLFAVAALATGVRGADPGPLPPGWKPRGPYEEEKTFVPPQATEKVGEGVRRLSSGVQDERKFKGGVISPRILIDNPYLDPADPFFNVPRAMACLPDGSLAVFSTAKLHREGRMKGNPYATGVWRVAPDGAITAIGGARHALSEGNDPACGVPAARSGLDPRQVGAVSTAPDGGLLFPYGAAWGFGRKPLLLRLTPGALLEAVPDDAQWCAPQPPETLRRRFNDLASAAQDPEGNVWAMDAGGCTLFRIGRDGEARVLLKPEQVCPVGQPESFVRAQHMVWDSSRGELVTAGTLLWQQKPKADLYSTVWRIRPDGSFRRIYLAGKLRKDLPRVDGIGGLALDGKGVIHFGAGIAASGGGFQIVRLDEAQGRTAVVAGAPRPTDVSHADGPARQAHFGTVQGLCFSADGTLFVHDANHLIRRLTPAGQVGTWAF